MDFNPYQSPTACSVRSERKSIWLVIASVTVAATGTAMACAVWLKVYHVPAGTSFRPMLENLYCFIIGGGSSLLSLGLAIAAACDRQGKVRWALLIPLIAVSLAPLPVAFTFAHEVFRVQGLEPAE